MPRKGHVQKRDVLADPLYNNKVVTKLINADGDGDGKLSVYISTNKYSVDPLQNPIFKDFVANIKLNMKEGEAKAE